MNQQGMTTTPEARAAGAQPEAAAAAPPSGRTQLVSVLFRFQSILGLVAVFIAAVLFSPHRGAAILFLTSENLFNVVRAVAEIGIIAVGMTFVILVGGIDLSVGAVLGLAAVGAAVLMTGNGLGVLPTVLIVLLIGLVFGLLQGFASARFGIQAFIVTLAGLQVARGLARIWSGGQGVAIAYGTGPGEAPLTFSLLGERTFDGLVPIPALIFAVVAAAAIVFLRISVFSRHLYAVGGNEKAARLAGVPVTRVKIIVFGVCGALSALAGIVHAGQLNQGSPNDGLGYELDAIAAVVIGGTSLSGGRGSVVGTVAGALLLGILNNVLALNNIDANIQLLIKGLVIVAAAGLQRLRPAL
jgi:ribose transport system permease protein